MSQDTDRQAEFVVALRAELFRARQHHKPIHSAHEGASVIREEWDELWDAVKGDDLRAACAEAVQIAAMALRFILDLDPEGSHWSEQP